MFFPREDSQREGVVSGAGKPQDQCKCKRRKSGANKSARAESDLKAERAMSLAKNGRVFAPDFLRARANALIDPHPPETGSIPRSPLELNVSFSIAGILMDGPRPRNHLKDEIVAVTC